MQSGQRSVLMESWRCTISALASALLSNGEKLIIVNRLLIRHYAEWSLSLNNRLNGFVGLVKIFTDHWRNDIYLGRRMMH